MILKIFIFGLNVTPGGFNFRQGHSCLSYSDLLAAEQGEKCLRINQIRLYIKPYVGQYTLHNTACNHEETQVKNPHTKAWCHVRHVPFSFLLCHLTFL